MIVYKSDVKRWVAILSVTLLQIMIIELINGVLLHILLILAFVVLAVFMSKFDFSHPFFWFSAFHFLYACAYMIILVIAPGDSMAIGYNKTASVMIVLSLGVTLLCCSSVTAIKRECYIEMRDYRRYKGDIKLLKTIYYMLAILFVVCTLILKFQGVTSKAEQWEAHNMFWSVASYCTRFMVFINAIVLFLGDTRKNNIKLIIISFVLLCFFSLLTGERDAVLRLAIVVMFSLSMLGIIRLKHLLIMGPLFVLGMMLLNMFKYYFSTGSINDVSFERGQIIYSFLYTDFVTCGYNIHMLLGTPATKGILGYGTLIEEMILAVVPSGVLNSILGSGKVENASSWYNNYFFAGSSWSRDFSLIGEGYVIGGIVGVIVLFIIIGLLIRWMYRNSVKSPYAASFYAYGAGVIIAGFRGDAYSIFQSLFRIPILMLIMIWCLKHLSRKIIM